jgi:hypothetical protein
MYISNSIGTALYEIISNFNIVRVVSNAFKY